MKADRWSVVVGLGIVCLASTAAWASTGTGFDQAGQNLSNVYRSTGMNLAGAGIAAILFMIVGQHLGSPVFVTAIGILLAGGLLFSWETVVGWVGMGHTAELAPLVFQLVQP